LSEVLNAARFDELIERLALKLYAERSGDSLLHALLSIDCWSRSPTRVSTHNPMLFRFKNREEALSGPGG
jgi:hypothetical protein